jgi:spermidine synthase
MQAPTERVTMVSRDDTTVYSPAGATIGVPVRQTGSLFIISVLGLFLELLLIRWISTEIRIFAYLQNTVLVVCFLGLGLGCLTSDRTVSLRHMLLPLAILSGLLAVPFTRHALGSISNMLSEFGGVSMWSQFDYNNPVVTAMAGVVGLALTLLLMILIFDAFVPIGQLLGSAFDRHPRIIRAYSANVAGSLVGIWLFVGLSAAYEPPVVWMAVLALMLLLLTRRQFDITAVDVALITAILVSAWVAGRERGALEVAWSPYQKLALFPTTPVRTPASGADVGVYWINVNNVGYQSIIDLSAANVAEHPELFAADMRGLSQYDLPAVLHPTHERMLFVGSGAGNDPAGGVRNGAKRVVAVEIDPAIIDFGRRYHPEHPYSNPNVEVVNDDARSYFANTPEKTFDVISFGLLDSHTTTAMTNARLDHYVYTTESLRRARALLRPGGIMVLTFVAEKPFIADRIFGVLRNVWDGQTPIVVRVPASHYGWGGVVFVAGDLASVHRQIDLNPRLKALIDQWQTANPLRWTGTTPPTTDDWPYLYLEGRGIPTLYYFLGGLLILLLARGLVRLRAGGLITGWKRDHWHFFFLGAAFLLLEVQNISKASVVLGNTWWVNAVIISSILVLVLIANLIVARYPDVPLTPIFVALCASCLLFYFFDLARLAVLPYVPRAIAVGALTCLPMLFSGIIFMRSFASGPRRNVALGANLIGALVGGLLQSITFVTGIKALLLIVATLYLAAWVTGPRLLRETRWAAEAP